MNKAGNVSRLPSFENKAPRTHWKKAAEEGQVGSPNWSWPRTSL